MLHCTLCPRLFNSVPRLNYHMVHVHRVQPRHHPRARRTGGYNMLQNALENLQAAIRVLLTILTQDPQNRHRFRRQLARVGLLYTTYLIELQRRHVFHALQRMDHPGY